MSRRGKDVLRKLFNETKDAEIKLEIFGKVKKNRRSGRIRKTWESFEKLSLKTSKINKMKIFWKFSRK